MYLKYIQWFVDFQIILFECFLGVFLSYIMYVVSKREIQNPTDSCCWFLNTHILSFEIFVFCLVHLVLVSNISALQYESS